MKKISIIEVIASLFIVLFIYTGLSKAIHHEQFINQMRKSPFISSNAQPLSFLVPAVELVTATLLYYRKTQLLGYYFSFFLMLLFTGYVYLILQNSNFIPCSCGGVLQEMSWRQHLLFNLVFSLLALIGILLQAYNKSAHKARKITPPMQMG